MFSKTNHNSFNYVIDYAINKIIYLGCLEDTVLYILQIIIYGRSIIHGKINILLCYGEFINN